MRGYFAIGIMGVKYEVNVGTLWRTAYQFGADFIFTIGKQYAHQYSDTLKTQKHIPLLEFEDYTAFNKAMPRNCSILGVEGGKESYTQLTDFNHPQRSIYLLGAEDKGLSQDILTQVDDIITINSVNTSSFNVSVAGSIIMYDRFTKQYINKKGNKNEQT